MSTLFNKIYVGTRAAYDKVAPLKDADSLYLVTEDNNCHSIYKGESLVSGTFRIINGAETSIADSVKEEGVIYYISEFGKTEDVEGSAWVGFWNGNEWVPIVSSSDISTLQATVEANKAAITKLNGDDSVAGSVANSIKTAIEALDVADTPTEGSVVVAVSETNGVVSTTKQAVTIEKSATDAGTDYTLKIGNNAIAQKISVPDSARLLETSKLGDTNDTFSEDTGAISPATDPSGTEVLHLVFKLADNKFEKVSINVEDFLNEAEFKDGLKVSNHEVSVNLTEDGFLQLDGETEGSKTLGVKVVTIESQKEDDAEDGLVKASDAYKVIIDNEKVTAAALNDLHTRIGDNDDLQTTSKNTVGAINELKTAIDSNCVMWEILTE